MPDMLTQCDMYIGAIAPRFHSDGGKPTANKQVAIKPRREGVTARCTAFNIYDMCVCFF